MSKKIVTSVVCLISCVAQATGDDWFYKTGAPVTEKERRDVDAAGKKPIPVYMVVTAKQPSTTTAASSRPSSSLCAAPTSPSGLNKPVSFSGFTLHSSGSTASGTK
jgi:hypothetical protein